MSNNGVTRVHFYSKQYLRLQDFEDEQRYHLSRLRQHQVGHHSWGIVRGLELALNEDQIGLVIQPGVAVDGYGRLLVLDHIHPLSEDEFNNRSSNELEVWLVYSRQESDQPLEGYAGCNPPDSRAVAPGGRKNGSSESFSRWQEQPVVRLTVPDLVNPTRPRQPEDVPEGDWNFEPTRTPPDSPFDDWPVYLGQASRTQEQPRAPFSYNSNLAGRPYAGLVGEVIAHPSGRAWIQIGADETQPADNNRFAVFLDDPQQTFSPRPPNGLTPQMEIDQDGQMTIRGPTTVEGDIIVSRGSVAFGAGQAYNGPMPWRLYRVQTQTEPGGPAMPEQWRLELGEGGEFSVGYYSNQDKEFKECLKVSPPCKVRITGDLHVTGEVREKVLVPPELSPQAATLATSTFMAPLLGQAIVPRPLLAAREQQIDRPDVGVQENLTLIAQRVSAINPELARNLVVALTSQLNPEATRVVKEALGIEEQLKQGK